MDMQKMMDAMSQSMRNTRKDYHLTLGGLIKVLEEVPKETNIVFSDGTNVGSEMSYRGYYSDLSFEIQKDIKKASDLLKQCKKALNKKYYGYKGGDFLMDADTPLWKSEYGDCGEAIMGSVVNNGTLVLVTRKID